MKLNRHRSDSDVGDIEMIDLNQKLLTVADVAAYVNRDPKTVRRWIERRRLRATCPSGQWLIHPDDLDRFLDPDAGTDRLAPPHQ